MNLHNQEMVAKCIVRIAIATDTSPELIFEALCDSEILTDQADCMIIEDLIQE